MTLALIGIATLIAIAIHRRDTDTAMQVGAAGAGSSAPRAMVLPVEVHAEADESDDAAWLRLGLMDLIASRLRNGGIATAASEAAVSMLQGGKRQPDARVLLGEQAFLVQPSISRDDAGWRITLRVRDGNVDRMHIESRADNPLDAARLASDELLAHLGRRPQANDPSEAETATTSLLQRIQAANLAGNIEGARSIAAEAPESLRASPEIALAIATTESYAGNYEHALSAIGSLIDSLHVENPAQRAIRARAQGESGRIHMRLGQAAQAENAFRQAIDLLDGADDVATAIAVWTGLGAAQVLRNDLSSATTSLGRARAIAESVSDLYGIARIDLNLGVIALMRGQAASALPLLEGARDRFERIGAREARNATLRNIVDAQSLLLDHAAALRTTDAFWPPERHGSNEREYWWLVYSRARALAGVGRMQAAMELLERLRADTDAHQDASVRAEADALRTLVAEPLDRPAAEAASEAIAALTPELERSDWRITAATRVLAVERLLAAGDMAAAEAQARTLREWAHARNDDWSALQLLRADALLASARGDDAAAITDLEQAMRLATSKGTPDWIVSIGLPYVRALLRDGQLAAAVSVSGQLAPWADRDPRASLAQALVYDAEGRSVLSRDAHRRAQALAGDRRLPMPSAIP